MSLKCHYKCLYTRRSQTPIRDVGWSNARVSGEEFLEEGSCADKTNNNFKCMFIAKRQEILKNSLEYHILNFKVYKPVFSYAVKLPKSL